MRLLFPDARASLGRRFAPIIKMQSIRETEILFGKNPKVSCHAFPGGMIFARIEGEKGATQLSGDTEELGSRFKIHIGGAKSPFTREDSQDFKPQSCVWTPTGRSIERLCFHCAGVQFQRVQSGNQVRQNDEKLISRAKALVWELRDRIVTQNHPFSFASG